MLNVIETDEDWREDRRQWEQEIASLERVIAKNGRHDLDVLMKAGANRETMLRLLALAATSNLDWHNKQMRRQQSTLRIMQARLEKLAKDAEKIAKDPASMIQVWAFLRGWAVPGSKFPDSMTSDPGIEFTIAGMRALAKKFGDHANRFGKFLRAYSRTDFGIVVLLARYRLFRPRMDHLEELARLLTDAFEASGKTETFSADGLRKTYKRHGIRFLRRSLKFGVPVKPAASDIIPALTSNLPSPVPLGQLKPLKFL